VLVLIKKSMGENAGLTNVVVGWSCIVIAIYYNILFMCLKFRVLKKGVGLQANHPLKL
jgi:hypothetical protein